MLHVFCGRYLDAAETLLPAPLFEDALCRCVDLAAAELSVLRILLDKQGKGVVDVDSFLDLMEGLAGAPPGVASEHAEPVNDATDGHSSNAGDTGSNWGSGALADAAAGGGMSGAPTEAGLGVSAKHRDAHVAAPAADSQEGGAWSAASEYSHDSDFDEEDAIATIGIAANTVDAAGEDNNSDPTMDELLEEHEAALAAYEGLRSAQSGRRQPAKGPQMSCSSLLTED